MDKYVIEKIAHLAKTSIFRVTGSGEILPFQSEYEANPIYQSPSFREKLMTQTNQVDFPYIYKDKYSIYYACIKAEDSYCMVGPMATEYLNHVRRHEYSKEIGIKLELEKNLHLFTVDDVLQTICLLTKVLLNKEYEDEWLIEANHLTLENKEKTHQDAILYNLQLEDDEENCNHSYREERHLLDAVREGNVQEALKRNKEMDKDIGKLSQEDLAHWKCVLVIGAALCARAAIEGGVSPYKAYRISGYYINKGSSCRDILQVLSYRNQAVEQLTKNVYEIKSKRHTSSYTLQCQDYIGRHYREKIYLEDIAKQLGITGSYLSRLFKKETGTNLQDYITDVRVEHAANLLVYSEESIPRIAEYVNFPSQSYFGRIFKEKMHMTPREYREKNRPAEFVEKDNDGK